MNITFTEDEVEFIQYLLNKESKTILSDTEASIIGALWVKLEQNND